MRGLMLLGLFAACRPPGYGKHAPDAREGVDASLDAALTDAAAAVCHQDFRLDGHGTAASVMLTGDFTSWGGDVAHGAIAFSLGADGGWTGSHDFAQGTYQYKFVIDGTQWIADPTNPDTVDDGFGGVNSVYTCTP
jgi:hypothetical protein